MNRSRIFFAGGLIAALIIGIFVGGVFKENGEEHESGSHQGNHSGSRFSDDDVMFAQMMVPHHQQAVLMSEIALKNSTNPEVLALATQIRDAQAPEIKEMQGWLSAADSDLDEGHEMSMSGMLTKTEIENLRSSTGAPFDRLFIEGMIAHHKSAISMADLVDRSRNAAVKKLAGNIVKAQTAEIKTMEELLTRLP